jgi:DNA-binding transcriptional LysR family regulator
MDKSMVTLERLRTFARVAERGNFSAVARELDTGQPTITRHVRDLEQALGVQLFSRTTRRVTLTDEGRRFYDSTYQVLQLIEQSCEDVAVARGQLSGTVRLSCTAALGVRHITRLLFEFQDANPGITVDLSLADERVNLVQEGVDIALRLGPVGDSSMKLRRLGESRRLLVASPAYLEQWGTPYTPYELIDHEGVRMTNVIGSDRLRFAGPDGEEHDILFDGRFRVDHGLAVREALMAGRGVALAHLWLVDDLLDDGRLTQLLPDYAFEPVPMSLLIVPERAQVPRVRRLVDFLVSEVAKIPGLG